MKENTMLYVLLAVAAVLVGFVLYGAVSGGNPAASKTTGAAGTSGIPPECGDITDNANVQHLSHHPAKFAECIKLVDPAKFREAVGVDKATFMSQNGIK